METRAPRYIRIASDLHIESHYGQSISKIIDKFLPEDPVLDKHSILVLAGDISSKFDQLLDFLEVVEKRFVNVIFVPGNHEFYHYKMEHWIKNFEFAANQRLKKTIHSAAPMSMVHFDGVAFVFGTMWGDGGKNPLDEIAIQNGLADFELIGYADRVFNVHDMRALNKQAMESLDFFLKKVMTAPVVVVTHHLPSYELCHPRFGTSINGGFACSCDDMLAGGHPALWIHGHTHDTIDTEMYGTRIIANPHGYKRETNATKFNSYGPKFISLADLKPMSW